MSGTEQPGEHPYENHDEFSDRYSSMPQANTQRRGVGACLDLAGGAEDDVVATGLPSGKPGGHKDGIECSAHHMPEVSCGHPPILPHDGRDERVLCPGAMRRSVDSWSEASCESSAA